MKWFRVYSEIKDDPKMLELDFDQRWVWITLMAMASESGERGVIAYTRPRGLAASLRIEVDRLTETLGLLEELGMVTVEDGSIRLSHWDDRQYDKPSDTPEAARDRKRRSRARHAHVTPSHATDTDTDTDTDTELPRGHACEGPRDAGTDEDAAAAIADEQVYETAEILMTAPFVRDPLPAVIDSVHRSFRLLGNFTPRDGPYLAERFVGWPDHRSNPPGDWYQRWLSWVRRETREPVASRAGTGPDPPADVPQRPRPELVEWVPYDQR